MSEPKRPPAQEADDAAAEYTGTMRGFVAGLYLHESPDGLTTQQIADLLGLSWKGAWALMGRLCGVREFGVTFHGPRGEPGRWHLMNGADGFEGNPPQR